MKRLRNLRAIYAQHGVALPGWQIKTADIVGRSVACVPEPHGGEKVDGRSPSQTAYAHLFAAAPELLAVAHLATIHIMESVPPHNRRTVALICRLKRVIRKAKGGAK